MSETKASYVGVSGIVSPEIQGAVERMHLKSGLAAKGRELVLGVKAVHKTQYLDIENKYGPDWYPIGASAFNEAIRHDYPSPVAKPVAQAYLDVDYVGDAGYRTEFLHRIHERGQPWLKGIQFDMLPWHADDGALAFLEEVKESTGLEVFLQAHSAAMTELGPSGVIGRLGRYASVTDYVLFDASHGTGKRLDTTALEPFVAEAYAQLDPVKTGVAIAGGLNEEVVRDALPALIEKYPDLSWDAEGQLHPVTESGARPLDLAVTEAYLRASSEILPDGPHDPTDTQRAIIDSELYWFGGLQQRRPFPFD
jgi:hypothetical protein